jgi:Surface antigen variable number repeat
MEIGILPLLVCWGPLHDAALPTPRAARVGQIFIVGNERTDDAIIRGLLRLYPGNVFDVREVREAERRVVQSGYFQVDADQGIRPRISILSGEPGSDNRDILIEVQERPPPSQALPTAMVLAAVFGIVVISIASTCRGFARRKRVQARLS